jgi:hypothetical protein
MIALGSCRRKFLVIRLVFGQAENIFATLLTMGIERSENWFLRKHDNGEVFGPVSFEKIREWTHSAQVNPQDVLSMDQVIWTKAPMIPDLEMDWLVVIGENLLYGPTTAEALLEFERRGEISFATALINCKTGETTTLREAPFYQISQTDLPQAERTSIDILTGQPLRGGQSGSLRLNLQQRIRELESALLDKRRRLVAAEETITRLKSRIRELEERIRDYSGFRRS